MQIFSRTIHNTKPRTTSLDDLGSCHHVCVIGRFRKGLGRRRVCFEMKSDSAGQNHVSNFSPMNIMRVFENLRFSSSRNYICLSFTALGNFCLSSWFLVLPKNCERWRHQTSRLPIQQCGHSNFNMSMSVQGTCLSLCIKFHTGFAHIGMRSKGIFSLDPLVVGDGLSLFLLSTKTKRKGPVVLFCSHCFQASSNRYRTRLRFFFIIWPRLKFPIYISSLGTWSRLL